MWSGSYDEAASERSGLGGGAQSPPHEEEASEIAGL